MQVLSKLFINLIATNNLSRNFQKSLRLWSLNEISKFISCSKRAEKNIGTKEFITLCAGISDYFLNYFRGIGASVVK